MRVLAVLMAGGAGTRLTVLSDKRAKPAVPFAGKYRIIDFTLSNCVNSSIYDVAVLTQYRPHSLNTHIGIGKPWDLDRQRGGVHLRQPYQGNNADLDWYRGTADAVFRNLDFIQEKDPDFVVILSGDHIYKMDYRPMLEYHVQKGADLTVGVMEIPLEETDRFGIMTVNRNMRVTEFHEKPKDRDKGTLASMGIYVFSTDILVQRLSEGTAEQPRIDFGKHVIPDMISQDKVYAYPFEGYWVDVGTIHSFWETNLAMTSVEMEQVLNLHDANWVIHTRSQERPPVKLGPQARIIDSLVSNGCVIRGQVERSVLSPGVYVSPGAVVKESVIINDTWIGPGAIVDKAIIDENVVIGAGTYLGYGDDMTVNHEMPDKLNTGITVVGANTQIPGGITIGRNVLIKSGCLESDFPGTDIGSGETV
ncbi:MAG TPA: glucose-1-phosphate adenylyltransferase [Anaerolineae bacterium]|nr:glucose-1-phosphate adenylyltransferase [Anaerolineae bacterium]MCB0222515.1 glucose-1-phosphate adenylyltransferase [Anaerolineae bacterium]MCB9105272.1 glucose-1-phosphate adenylyltransferase [Anaerolineales bacterium]HRV94024.1 glucose-1-phosphate adenylyltransferase [Anaerolineae bacterium]